ncbi:hypothetical protein [Aquimarina pacifica]|uniref:hypothetical protein n=1 Tax=Aquimarina pacifica TaxID=1296415 RepID=UPI0004B6B3C3|nr:hypothetical protein [Aquimarina pacifica]
MKITTLLTIFILSTIHLNAQQTELITNNVSSNQSISIGSENETICQAELSKIAYYKALINQNNLEINDTDVVNGVVLTNKENTIYTSKTAYYKALIKKNNLEINDTNTINQSVVLKNTEDIISNPRSRISYSN